MRSSVRADARVAFAAGCALLAGIAAAFPAGAALGPEQLGVVVNSADPLSVAIGEYYQRVRRVPAANVIRVRIPAAPIELTEREFNALRASLARLTPPGVQAYALAWVKPYRVECMSITAAIAFGFDRDYCSIGCSLTRESPLFNSDSPAMFRDYRIRPAMLLAATSLADARALIDRGVAADGSRPRGTAYLVSTGDEARNVRAPGYPLARIVAGDALRVEQLPADALESRTDVMFYFIGARVVDQLDSNRFLPGAVADHLTSTGGDLLQTRQMSSLRWLQAGATGSYGSVAEPCSFTAKFPNPAILLKHYLAGETLIEAYWKSVAMPGQGLFIGEPLARPFGTPSR
jgi:uncharacterized protein (TIGR03790 family)